MPGREPVISEDEKKSMMAYYYRKQEDFKVSRQFVDSVYLSRASRVRCISNILLVS